MSGAPVDEAILWAESSGPILARTEVIKLSLDVKSCRRFVSEINSSSSDPQPASPALLSPLTKPINVPHWAIDETKDVGVWTSSNEPNLKILLTTDKKLGLSRGLIVSIGKNNAPFVVSDHLVHPLTLFKGENRSSTYANETKRIFWVQDWVGLFGSHKLSNASRSRQICLDIDFFHKNDAHSFTLAYLSLQQHMRETHRHRKEISQELCLNPRVSTEDPMAVASDPVKTSARKLSFGTDGGEEGKLPQAPPRV